jgi:protein-tyrosine phosphatase
VGSSFYQEHFEMTHAYSVLFVCTGNICRSPTAHGVMRHMARQKKLEDKILIDSAGTHDYHVGQPPDRRSIAMAARRGVDISDLRARAFDPIDFRRFDVILAMDGVHLSHLNRFAKLPEQRAKTALFLDYTGQGEGENIPDPYYGSGEGFIQVYDMIEQGCAALLEKMMLDIKT